MCVRCLNVEFPTRPLTIWNGTYLLYTNLLCDDHNDVAY